jgi:hypothetical protein
MCDQYFKVIDDHTQIVKPWQENKALVWQRPIN